MALGQLNAVVELHRPHRRYYGNQEAITGDIVLTYTPKAKKNANDHFSVDLFGPLRIEVIFEGSLTIKIPDTDKHREYNKARRIFRSIHCVHDGSFRCAPGQTIKVPFRSRFPEVADSCIDFRTGQETSGRLLPPSMKSSLLDGTRMCGTDISYLIRLDIAMQGIDVDIHADSAAIVLYERAMTSRSPQKASQSCVRTIELKSKQFLAHDEKRRGMKGVFLGVKKLTFGLDVHINGIPSTLCLNQPVSLGISMCRNREKTTATVTPPAMLESVAVQMLAITRVAEPRFGTGRAYSTSDTQLARTLSTKIMEEDEAGLIGIGDVYRATVAVWPLLDVPTSFTWGEVTRFIVWESVVEVLPPTANGVELSQMEKSITGEHFPTYQATCS
ncbi:hypothetical protein LTR86_005253 [Recurvomyces mirabilis]|nr:hypothetical protein LTR86_005253 [Recurvomyces mirabilis]